MQTIKLPWQELAEDTYRSVFTQSKTVFDLSALWLMVAVLLVFLGFGVYPQLTADDLGGIEAYLSLPVVLGLFGLVTVAIFATRWTRWITLDHLPQLGQGMVLGKTELKVGWAAVESLTLGLAPFVAAVAADSYLTNAFGAEIALGLQGLGLFLGVVLLARFGMAVNLAALHLPGDALIGAFRLTQGQGLRLVLLLLISVGPAVLASWGMAWMLDWAIEPMPDLLPFEMRQSLLLVLTAAMGFVGGMLFLGAMGLAARSLILAGEDPWEATEPSEIYDEASPGADAYVAEEDDILDMGLGDLIEEPMAHQDYAAYVPPEEEVLQLRATQLVDTGPVAAPDLVVPVDSHSWVDGQAAGAGEAEPGLVSWAEGAQILGRKIGAARGKLPLADIVKQAYASVFGELAIFMSAAWPWMILSGVALFAADLIGPAEELADVMKDEPLFMSGLLLLLMLTGIVASSGFLAKWALVIGRNEMPLGLRAIAFGRAEWQVFVSFIVVGLMLVLAAIPLTLLSFLLAFLLDNFLSKPLVLTVVTVLAVAGLLLVWMRLALTPVLAAMDEPGSRLKLSLRLTKGNAWRLFAVTLAAALPVAFVQAVIVMVVMLATGTSGGGDDPGSLGHLMILLAQTVFGMISFAVVVSAHTLSAQFFLGRSGGWAGKEESPQEPVRRETPRPQPSRSGSGFSLPKLKIDVGDIAAEGWKLAVLLVLLVLGYLFLFTDVITDFLI